VKNAVTGQGFLCLLRCRSKVFALWSETFSKLRAADPWVLRVNRRSLIGGYPSWGGQHKDESAAQNFVDIMVKIHNKIQNIKSPNSNRRPYRRVLGKLQNEGLLFVVGVSGVLKIICLSKI
jgi:hypothetical protein